MNFAGELAAHAVYLIVNLTLLGSSVAAGLVLAFRLTRVASPRIRYWISVAAFVTAVAAPLAATLSATREPERAVPISSERVSVANHLATVEAFGSSTRTFTQPLSAPFSSQLKVFAHQAAESPLAIGFLAAWMGVALLLLAREAAGHLMLARARRAWQPAPATRRQELAWPDEVPLYLDEHAGPSAVGWLHPAVVLPARLLTDMSAEAAQRIARHELAHARWRDPLVNALLRIMRIVLWPSLPLWFLSRVIHAEREAAADRAAMDVASSSADASRMVADYAASLVRLAQWPKRGVANLTGSQLGGVAGLEDRVRRLLQASAPLTLTRLVLGSAMLLAGVLGMAFLPVMSQPLQPTLTALAQGLAVEVNAGPLGSEKSSRSEDASEIADATISEPDESAKREASALATGAAISGSEQSHEQETTPLSEKAKQDSESERQAQQVAQASLFEKLEQNPDVAVPILNLGDAPLIIRHATMKNLTREEDVQYWHRDSRDSDSPRSPDAFASDQSATMPRATVFNNSNRRITGIAFGFRKKDGTAWSPVIGETKLALEPGASFNYRAKWSGTNIGIPSPAGEITILVVGVEFDDGSIWGDFPFSKHQENERTNRLEEKS